MSDQAEVKNFEKEVAERKKSDFEKRIEKIDAGISVAAKAYAEGSTTVLTNGMNAAYKPFHVFATADEKTQGELKKHYEEQCAKMDLPTTHRLIHNVSISAEPDCVQ